MVQGVMHETGPVERAIEGVTLTLLREIADERGAVLHMLRADSPEFTRFGECYFSEVRPGMVKAWKRHRLQTQTFAVPIGRIRLVIFDDREGSDTHGQLQVLELGRPDAYFRLQIRPNLWYGFGCLGETPALVANCTDLPHQPSESEARSADDSLIPYQWSNPLPTHQASRPTLMRLSKSCLSSAEKEAVMRVLDREFLGMGAEVQRFEDALAHFFDRPTVCVGNGTAALHLAVQGCQIGPGDEVLVPSLTYVASFQAISATGAKPVACDIDPETCILDWHDAERRLSSRTKAVMAVHYTGGVGDLDDIAAFASRHGLRLIEDAAHAFGTTHGGRRVGSFGDIACFSFDGIKNITSGEGGCIVTSDPAVLGRIRDARLLGVEKDTEERYRARRSWEFDVTAQGWRYHMSDVMAAIGLAQLKRFPELAATRQRLARLYDERLSGHPRIRPLPRDYRTVVPHIYVARVEGIGDRKALQARLLEDGIQTGIHYQPNHLLSLYSDPQAPALRVTETVFPELLTLPLHPDLTEQDVATVCRQLKAHIS
jgi:dTDP-4-amino-4,6-dideoxygalactose transaminase/dTDP-4-dehydrorhamnose 3,5-epimerase-like enzyme